jgi:glucose-6-phosphate-specific signal transduction histidine kinase
VNAEKRLREINEQLGLLTTELIMTEERERRKISIDLHDNIGQTLALTKIKFEQMMKETLITCPKCGGNACSEMTNGVVTIWICYGMWIYI